MQATPKEHKTAIKTDGYFSQYGLNKNKTAQMKFKIHIKNTLTLKNLEVLIFQQT